MLIEIEDAYRRTEEAHAEAGHDLRQRVLTQNHAGGAHDAGHHQHQAKPPDGVEDENHGEGKQGACHTADGCRMGGNLPPHVDDGTDDLHQQGGHENAAHEVEHVHRLQQPDARQIAQDGDDVRHHATLAIAHFDEVPPLMLSIEVNDVGGQQDGEEIDDGDNLQSVDDGQKGQIAEREQDDEPHQREVEGREQHAHDACHIDNVFFA